MDEARTKIQAAKAVPDMLQQWTGMKPDIELEGAQHGGRHPVDWEGRIGDVVFAVEVKGDGGVASISRAIKQVKAHVEGNDQVCPIIVVPYMSEGGRRRCEQEGISWIDLSGNARVRLSGDRTRIAVWVEGKPDAFRKRGRPRNAFAPKASRIVRHLLLHPERSVTQAELAEETGLGAGYTSRIVRRLEGLDLLIRDQNKAVRLKDYDLLLDAWAEADAFRHDVIHGHVPGRSGEDRMRRLAQALEASGLRYGFTGLAAAWAYTHAAAFRSAACYVVPDEAGTTLSKALQEAGFREESSAPNTRILIPGDEGVLNGVQRVEEVACVSPVQAYVDLAHEPERAEEMQEALRTHVITKNAAGLAANE